LIAIRRRIERAGGDPAAVRVVGVTKGFGPEAVRAAREAGLEDLGENYAAELVTKAAAVVAEGTPGPDAETETDSADNTDSADSAATHTDRDGIVWHFLGAVQRNKVAQLAPLVGLWQSVAREAEGARIAHFAPGARVLVQVDTTGLPGRNGCTVSEVPGLVPRLGELGLDVRGLMTVAGPGEAAAREAFAATARLADQLGLEERSMGMSDDLEAAVAAGSTMVRIGRALFGARPPRAPLRGGG
jgi:uncharacterized pyridoxal phosphate-containing UPF0001 family protein